MVRQFQWIAVVAAALVGGSAYAQTTLTLEAPSTVQVQQTSQNPCIFGANCNQTLPFTQFGPNQSVYEEFSPVYTVQQITATANSNAFALGIDVNRAGSNLELLEFFRVFVNGTLQFQFVDSVSTPGTLQVVSNGTGFSDDRLLGIDLSAFSPTDSIQFQVRLSNATDGRESIFIIAAAPSSTRNVVVQKLLSPTDDPGLFNLLIDGSAVATDVTHGGSGSQAITIGEQVTVAELAGTGTDLADYTSTLSCSGAGLTDPGGTTSATFTVPAGDGDIVCLFSNLQNTAGGTRNLIVSKALSPTDDPGLFDLLINDSVIVPDASNGDSDFLLVSVGADVTVAEAAGTGTSLANYTSALSCTGENLTDPGGTTSATFTIPDGTGDITCVFTNTRLTRNLTVSKSLSPTDDSGVFDLLINGSTVASDAPHNGSGSSSVDVGSTVTVSELAGTGTDLSDYGSVLSCSGTGVTDPGGTTFASFTVPAGAGDITCVFTNTAIVNSRTVTLTKALSPISDTGLFNLLINGSNVAANVSDGGTGSQIVEVGSSLTVAELAGTSTSLANYSSVLSCSGDGVTDPGGTTTATFDVPAGDGDIDCLITNTRLTRNVNVSKSLSPTDDPGLFNLVINSVTVAGDVGNGGSGSQTVNVGSNVTVTELAGTGTNLANFTSSLSCTGDALTDPGGTTSATFAVPDGTDDIDCVFTNTRNSRNVTVSKSLSPSDDSGLFNLLVNGSAVATDIGDGGNGSLDVPVGPDVTVAEAAGTGTDLADYTSTLSCTGDGVTDPGGTTTATFAVPAGDGDITCVITNTLIVNPRNITVSKTLSPTDDSGLFDLLVNGSAVVTDASNGGNGSTSVSVGASVTVSEIAGTGTDLADYTSTLSCSGEGVTDPGGTTSATFTVPDGQDDIVCVFTNTFVPASRTVTVTKALFPSNNPGLFDLLINGSTVAADASNGGNGSLSVSVGEQVTVSELAGTGTSLANYSSSVSCTGDGLTDPGGATSATFTVPAGDGDIACVFNNTVITRPVDTTPALVSCMTTAVPPVVRAEGIAELVGDIVLVCVPTSGFPPVDRYQINFSVSLNVNVTNNINFSQSGLSDAVLIVNENNCTTPAAAGSVFSCGPDPRFQDPQFGTIAAPNRLEWNKVDFPFPGADPDGPGGADPFPNVTTVRITSVRANASQLGVPESATFPSTQITAFVSVTGPTSVPITNNVINVAVPILGLTVTGPGSVIGLQCIDGDETGSITLREGFATAFKTIGVPTFTPGNTQWESGYFAPGSNNGGGASQATRFILRFFNIPQGVTLSVPNYVSSSPGSPLPVSGDNLELFLVPNAGADGAGGAATSAQTGSTTVALSSGFGQAVFEVHDSNPFVVESVAIALGVAWESDTAADLPAIGSGQVAVSFAPISTVTTASAAAPEPRFVDTSGTPKTFITIARCTTTLLFPFVTNQAGFDTGLAISNTSEDWLGTDPQVGACTIHYHGSTTGGGAAPSEQTSTVIPAGEQLIMTLSGGSVAQGIAGGPEFQGYIIAVCDFQYAHGFAFITDGFGGIPVLAQGYLALIIPEPVPDRVAGVPGLHGFSESLNH